VALWPEISIQSTGESDVKTAGEQIRSPGAKREEPEEHSPREAIAARYHEVRAFTEELCRPLEIEDYVIQSMPDASPAKWHLAHTSWFFETFVLHRGLPGQQLSKPMYSYLFNSYYNAVGPMHCRPRRGMISRPTVKETYQYRRQVDEAMLKFIEGAPGELWEELEPVVVLGLHHEQQHQELLLTDIKHMLAQNPLFPKYAANAVEEPRRTTPRPATSDVTPLRWVECREGTYWIGHSKDGFCFDNELPRHRVLLEPFQLASRLVTNGEYLAFIEDGGYYRAELWLSLGWFTVNDQKWKAPLYWENRDGEWHEFTLGGLRPINPDEPVCHVSYFEADAYARWAGARLLREAEREVASADVPIEGNFVESKRFHPAPVGGTPGTRLTQMFGDLWEWTLSAYSPYPGYRQPKGAIGEYNGKFMCNQYVLRGGSCATPQSHIRRTYRNFFAPDKRWQFMGIRLGADGL